MLHQLLPSTLTKPSSLIHPITCTALAKPNLFIQHNITAAMLALQHIHPTLNGNKPYKLYYQLQQALQLGCTTIVTYGGVWSNHIAATAAACQQLRIQSIGYIRGDEGLTTATLTQAKACGMQLTYISRVNYASQKATTGQCSINPLHYHIPEGGLQALGIKGAALMLNINNLASYTHIICPVGTGTTLAGLVNAALPHQVVLGVNALKGSSFQLASLQPYVINTAVSYSINNTYHFGGFAKCPSELIAFMNEWYTNTGIATDIVYTSKMFYAITQLVQQKQFAEGSNLLIIHTGGLQGNKSLGAEVLCY